MPDPAQLAATVVGLYAVVVFHFLVIAPRWSDAAEHRRNHIGARRHRQAAKAARVELTEAEAELRQAHLSGTGADVDHAEIEVQRCQAHVDRINAESAVEYGPNRPMLPVHPRRDKPARPAPERSSKARARRLYNVGR